MSRLRTLLSAVTGVALLAAAALATIVVHADVEKLTRLADAVVDGRVASVDTRRDSTGGIWTVAKVRVSEVLSGAERKTVEVFVPGGRIGELEQDVSGTAHLEKGDRAVLFLTEEDGRLLVLGQAQGCFRVARDPETKVLTCRNDVHGLALVSEDGSKVDARPIRITLTELREQVAAAVRKRAEAERARREAEERKLAELRAAAERNSERLRGKPGGGE